MNETTFAKIDYKGHLIQIVDDEMARSPRKEYENLGKMICFHRRYRFGDDHSLVSSDYSGFGQLKAMLEKENDIRVILPIYLYDHSGQTIRTYPFDCPWDSGQIGFIYATKKAICETYAIKRVLKKNVEQATKELENEIKTYDSWLRGEFCGYYLYDDNGNEVDSTWSFSSQEEAEQSAKEFIDSLMAKKTA